MLSHNLPNKITVSAPGSTMLFGEHAVCYGKKALCAAVDKSIRVTLTPRCDTLFSIQSDLGSLQADIQKPIEAKTPFSFVLAAIASRQHELPSGFDLSIESSFSHTVGLGSSAAVTVATLGALALFIDDKINKKALFDQALLVIRKVQKRGSGADIAASIYGGIVSYTMEPLSIEPLNKIIPIALVYSGTKTATAEVITLVQQNYQESPTSFRATFALMHEVTKTAEQLIINDDLETLGIVANAFHDLLDTIGVSNDALSEIVQHLQRDPEIFGAKISGSGLGDCVIGIGKISNQLSKYQILDVKLSEQGITYTIEESASCRI